MAINDDRFRGVRVLVTGHTGFKGSWLVAWLEQLGAVVTGFALPPEPPASAIYTAAGIGEMVDSHIGNINDLPLLHDVFDKAQPELVFHLAAQALVRRSYREPITTFATNVMGTAHLLEVCRQSPSVKGVIVVTSDKCYENREWDWSYRENDPLGGSDPYSASKGCAELVAQAYARSFFCNNAPLLATARAGNVVGGGDESTDRLVPDMVRSIRQREELVLRYPHAVRPWQHVLEPIHGYLIIGERFLAGDRSACGAWNFGPDTNATVSVEAFARAFMVAWGKGGCPIRVEPSDLHEAGLLRLDSARARRHLGWEGVLHFDETVRWVADWYRSGNPSAITDKQLMAFRRRIGW